MSDETTVVDKQQSAPSGKKEPIFTTTTVKGKGKERKYTVGIAGEVEGYKISKTAQKRNTDNFKKIQDFVEDNKAAKKSVENIEKFGKVGKAAIGALALGGLTAAIFSDGGRQTNAQLYGQQPRY